MKYTPYVPFPLFMFACFASSVRATVIQIPSDIADYELHDTLAVADYAYSSVGYVVDPVTGRNAVFIFALPPIASGDFISTAVLTFSYFRSDPDVGSFQLMNADLYGIGFSSSTSPILMYSESNVPESGATKLQDNLITPFAPEPGTVTLSIDPLRDYLQSFYDANPGYAGGQYAFLRINQDKRPPPLNPLRYYRIGMAELEAPQVTPKLALTIVPEPNTGAVLLLGAAFFASRRATKPK